MKNRANIDYIQQNQQSQRIFSAQKDIKFKEQEHMSSLYKSQTFINKLKLQEQSQMVQIGLRNQSAQSKKIKHLDKSVNNIMIILKNALRTIEKINKQKIHKLKKKQKRLMKTQQRYFSKIGHRDFYKKMRQLILELWQKVKNNGENQQNSYYKILKWIKKCVIQQDTVNFIKNTSQEFKVYLQIRLRFMLKSKKYLKKKSIQEQEKYRKCLSNIFEQQEVDTTNQSIKYERISHKIDKKAIMLAESHLSQFELNKKQNKNETDKLQQIKIKPILKLKKPRCPSKQCKEQLCDRKCSTGNHMIVICDKCGWNEHQCDDNKSSLDKSKYRQSLSILAMGQKVKNYNINRIKKIKKQNNIQYYLNKLGYQPIQISKFIPGMPTSIACNYPILAGQVWQQICKNRQQQNYLPLTIKQSTIKGAGLGVFTTQPIQKQGILVCSYLGEIGIGSKTPALREYDDQMEINNSFFTLGWLQKQILLMAPNLYSNVGRFINYNSPNKCNLKPSLCLLQTGKKQYQIGVFLTTTKKIGANEQLFYNYGPEYSQS